MKKNDLINAINKYYLGKRFQSVRWNVSDNRLIIDFKQSPSIIGHVEFGWNFEDCEFGIFDTEQFLKILNSMDADIEIKLGYERNHLTHLDIGDSGANARFLLADLSIIPEVNRISTIPEFDVEFDLDKSTIDRFLKGKAALDAATTFAVMTDGNNIDFILNYHNSRLVNDIKFTIIGDVKNQISDPIAYDLQVISDIFSANKDFDMAAKFEISKMGLLRLTFNGENWKSQYFTQMIEIHD